MKLNVLNTLPSQLMLKMLVMLSIFAPGQQRLDQHHRLQACHRCPQMCLTLTSEHLQTCETCLHHRTRSSSSETATCEHFVNWLELSSLWHNLLPELVWLAGTQHASKEHLRWSWGHKCSPIVSFMLLYLSRTMKIATEIRYLVYLYASI